MTILRHAWRCLWLAAISTAATAAPLSLRDGVTLEVPAPWQVKHDTRTTWSAERRDARGPIATLIFRVEQRRTHAEALQRLAQIQAELAAPVEHRVISGWPALERRSLERFQRMGEAGEARGGAADTPSGNGAAGASSDHSWRATTAVAAGLLVVRLETLLQPGAPASLADQALAIGRGLKLTGGGAQSEAEVLQLKAGKIPVVRPGVPATKPGGPLGNAGQTGKGFGRGGSSAPVGLAGEIEAAVSGDGSTLVTVTGCHPTASRAGAAFAASIVTGVPTGRTYDIDGDCSVTWGQSGNFYLLILGDGSNGGPYWMNLYASTDQAQIFRFTGQPVQNASSSRTNVDQPHLAADRWNAGPGGKDLLYLTWHEGLLYQPMIACSKDGGATWGSQYGVVGGSGSPFTFPRVTVGRDGKVFVVSRSGANVVIDKYAACDAPQPLAEEQGFPVSFVIQDVPCAASSDACTGSLCAVAGLDRCNSGNTLSSPTIAVDDLDPSHVFVAWAQTNQSGTQEIWMKHSRDGGLSLGQLPGPATEPPIVVNQGGVGQRFLPWLTVWDGVAYAGWYDRRNAAAGADLTRYFWGAARSVNGALVALPETDLSGRDDPQCDSAWPGGSRSNHDSETCPTQPQPAGYCALNTFDFTAADSKVRCDYGDNKLHNICPNPNEQCQNTYGAPKYGDYNGIAAGGGRLFTVWASGTSPADRALSHTFKAYAVATDLPSNHFVRDWTDDAAHHDTGVEPSTNADFWDTSDVWNQSSNAGPYPFVNDWVVGDNGTKGVGALGDDFAYARVSRRSPASPLAAAETVSLHFLTADFGFGLNFVPISGAPGLPADPTLTFAAADQSKTMAAGLPYHLDATASGHLCLAVQIAGPSDVSPPPALDGLTPGAATGALIQADNNKAQRNLYPVDGVTGVAGGAEQYAVVHNGGIEARTIALDYTIPERALPSLAGAQLVRPGEKASPLGASGRVVFAGMQPGESRFVGVRFGPMRGAPGQLAPVRFFEAGTAGPSSGFTIAARQSGPAEVAGKNLAEHQAVLGRLAKLVPSAEADAESKAAAALLGAVRPPKVEPARYADFLRQHAPKLPAIAAAVVKAAGSDAFGLAAAAAALVKQAAGPDAAALHTALLARIDAQLTAVSKASGDPADALQMVRWQRKLFAARTVSPAKALVAASQELVDAIGLRKAGLGQIPAFVQKVLPLLRQASAELRRDPALEAALAAIAAAGVQPAKLEKAHRDYLLRLSQLP